MDKLLAFSIMSSSPADIAGHGLSTRLTCRIGGKPAEAAPKKQQEEKPEQSSSPPERKQPEEAKAKRRFRFAPEFDGIDFCESLVSY